ncbi:MAG: hypothetical protein LBN21_02690 [Treponema sp.]|nr:hypothetical protein [Treponema sp.]
MAVFDVSRRWVILAPFKIPAAKYAAGEFSYYIDALRKKAGLTMEKPPIEDAAASAPDDSVPIILLNAGDNSRDHSGFTWRLGKDRIEIYGDSDRGLCNGIFDFLGNLGIRWPNPGSEELPSPVSGAADLPLNVEYPLKDDKAYCPADQSISLSDRSRVIINKKLKNREKEARIRWAARNKIDAVIFSFWDRSTMKKSSLKALQTAEQYALIIERGGWELSSLVPRRYFSLHRDLFRMEEGKRKRKFNFCPTNPATIALVKKQGAKMLSAIHRRAGEPAHGAPSEIKVLHLWPDKGHEETWCSCPACRAFTPEEQNRIAVNAAADALHEIDPAAQISCYEISAGTDGNNENGILLRPNVFRLNRVAIY